MQVIMVKISRNTFKISWKKHTFLFFYVHDKIPEIKKFLAKFM